MRAARHQLFVIDCHAISTHGQATAKATALPSQRKR